MKTVKCIFWSIFLTMLAFSCANLNDSSIITVSNEGDAMYKSIQLAVDNAKPGSLILIKPGVFKENIIIDKSLRIKGSGTDKTIIMANPELYLSAEAIKDISEKIKSVEPPEKREAAGLEMMAKFFKPMVLVKNASKIEISGLKMMAPVLDGKLASAQPYIIQITNASVLLIDCSVTGAKDGVLIEDKSDVTIKNSLFAGLHRAGITIGKCERDECNVNILDSDIRNCYYAGIIIRQGSQKVLISNSRISGSAWHGIRYDDSSPEIRDNLIFANARSGIYASGKTNGIIEGNVFYKNEMCGIAFYGKNRDMISGNVLASNLREGVLITDSSCQPEFKNNIFYDNPISISLWKMKTAETNLHFENNIFWGNRNIAVLQHKEESGKVISEDIALPKDSQSLILDPDFKDVPGRDFSPSPESPARIKSTGVTGHIKFDSPWKLTPEEINIIPESDTRDSTKWKIK
ncbi:MAG: right-handed parallel beta-helix repeat-containing protein [Victivallales bacterium]